MRFSNHAKRIITSVIGAPLLILFVLKANTLLFSILIILCILFGLIEFYSTISHSSDGIAHIAHLGGMVIGYLYLNYPTIIRKIKNKRDRNRFKVFRRGSPFDDDEDDKFGPTVH